MFKFKNDIQKLPNELAFFIFHAIATTKPDLEEFRIVDYDADRIYLTVDSDTVNYIIRMWNINEESIVYSVFYEKELNHATPLIEYDTYYF